MLQKLAVLSSLLLFLCVSVESFLLPKYINVSEHIGELCERQCLEDDHRVCYFNFVLEHYQAMGTACSDCAKGVLRDCDNPQCIVADGVERGVMSINRLIPGPAIQVCKGDMVIVDVVNNAQGTAATLHWHGLHMKETPHMDGVPFVTQCPIPFSSTFRYSFLATEAGTQFYHSHSGHHRVNGQYGALIIREPESSNPHSDKYDFDLPEHHIVISDWLHTYGEQFFPGLPSTLTVPSSFLVNGRGTNINEETLEHSSVPITKFLVKPGKRYRFRLINAMSLSCPVQMQVESHSLSIIASDSFTLKPQSFNTLVTNSGERYDFILTTNQIEGDYWIRFRGLGLCTLKPLETFALLRYESLTNETPQPVFPGFNETYPFGRMLNSPSSTCTGTDNNHCITELSALDEDNELLTKKPDQQIFLAFQNIFIPNEDLFSKGTYNHFENIGSNSTTIGAINNISLTFPAYPPLTQPSDIDESKMCDKCLNETYCFCIHRIKIKLHSIVELIIVDESAVQVEMHHPFHMHGYKLMITGLGQHPLGIPMSLNEAKKIEKSRGLARNYHGTRPPFKDTISIPNRGYAVVRFRADNPGFWVLHCHYEWHVATGMGLVVQVGEPDQMVKAPKDFPKCNNYVPDIPAF